MSRIVAARAGSLHAALMILLGGVALLLPSLSVTATSTPTSLVLIAVAMAVAALMAAPGGLGFFARVLPMPRPHDSEHHTVLAGGPATDPVHHPLRPRAPGLA